MKRPVLDIYKSKDGYRWRLIAANNRIICDGGEAYTRKPNAAVLAVRVARAIVRSTKVKP